MSTAESRSQSSIVAQAKRGHPAAIASLINRQLQPQGITAYVTGRADHLEIVLEAAIAPPITPTVAWIRHVLTRLELVQLQTVHIQGKAIAAPPAWTETLQLSAPPEAAQAESIHLEAHPEALTSPRHPQSVAEAKAEPIASPAPPTESLRERPIFAPTLDPTAIATPHVPIEDSVFPASLPPDLGPQPFPWQRLAWIGLGIAVPIGIVVAATIGLMRSISSIIESSTQMWQEEMAAPIALPVEEVLRGLLAAQKAYFTEYGEFAAQIEDLRLGLNLDYDSYYTYTLEVEADLVDVIAQPNQAQLSLYAGSVFVVEEGDSVWLQSILCEGGSSREAPKAFFNDDDVLVCPAGSQRAD